MIPFKLFGLQRTCTNVTRFILMNHYNVLSVEHGTEWKHGPIRDCETRLWEGQLAKIIICTKNPYAWLNSCYNYFKAGHDVTRCPHFKKNNWTLSEFIRNEHYHYPHPLRRYYELNTHWLKFVDNNPQRCAVVRNEDMNGLTEQVRTINQVAEHLGLIQIKDFSGIKRRVRNTCRLGPRKLNFEFYNKKEYLKNFTAEDMEFINRNLDEKLMKRLNYERNNI